MHLIDISIPTGPSTPEWPGDTPFSCGWAWDMGAGASVNVSTITTSPHVGTHADAPLHVSPGAPGADAMPLGAFHGPAVVVDVSDLDGVIALDTIDARLAGTPAAWATSESAASASAASAATRLLLRTGRSVASGTFPDAWPALAPECARALAARGVVLVGVDAPSVDDRDSKTLDVHHALFGGGAYVLENLDLRSVAPGMYELIAFPAKFAALDAAPVRAVLRR